MNGSLITIGVHSYDMIYLVKWSTFQFRIRILQNITGEAFNTIDKIDINVYCILILILTFYSRHYWEMVINKRQCWCTFSNLCTVMNEGICKIKSWRKKNTFLWNWLLNVIIMTIKIRLCLEIVTSDFLKLYNLFWVYSYLF